MTKRIEYIDAIKGFAIFLVVFAHAIAWNISDTSAIIHYDYGISPNLKVGGFLWQIIYSFHMPLFFFVAGYLFNINKTSFSEVLFVVKKKSQRLLIPWIMTGSLMLLVRGHWGYWFLLSLYELNVIFSLINVFLCKQKLTWGGRYPCTKYHLFNNEIHQYRRNRNRGH